MTFEVGRATAQGVAAEVNVEGSFEQTQEEVSAEHSTAEEFSTSASTLKMLIPLVDHLTSQPVIISDLSGCILWVNSAFTILNGWTHTEVAGLSPQQFLYGPATDSATVGLIFQQISRGLPVQCEVQHYCRDGNPIWVSLSAMPILDHQGAVCGCLTIQNTAVEKNSEGPDRNSEKLTGEVGLANRSGGYRLEDIEFLQPLMMSVGQLIDANVRAKQRTETERSLQETERWLEEIGRVSEVGAWELDATTNDLRWSAQTRRIHEVPEDYVPNVATAISFYNKEARPVISDAVQQGLNLGRPWDLELPLTTAKGNACWVRAIGRPEFENGKVVRVFGTFQDITRRHAEETEKEELQARVVQSQKMESVGRLAGGIAHDFNNMLAVILGHSEMLLLDESLTHQQRVHLKAIQSAGQRSADLTHQLLTFARTQNAAPQVVDPNMAVRRILDLLRKSAGENIQLDWLPGKGIGKVSIDPVQLDQILASLTMNSRDAIHGSGRILITTRREIIHQPRRLRSSELPAESYVILTVSDTGSGISEAALNYLFEPFNSTKKVGEGTGLGLATVYGIVHQAGGAIDVHSDPSIGTTFQIFLPEIAGTSDEQQQPSEISEASIAREQFEIVLLIEDEPALLRLGKLLLCRLGYTVLSAKNPREALQLVQSHGDAIHVVISDIVLPGMNGWELAHRISEMQPKIRFVMMSGYAGDQGRSERPFDKPISVLVKPFDLQRLASAVQNADRFVRLP